jgi:hypothetical protein
VITLKVWQLMVIGLGVLVAAYALMTMQHNSPGASASTTQEVQPAQMAQVRQLVDVTPTLQTFFAKHKSFARLKLAPASGVAVMSASKTTYCIETTGPAPHVFKNGPTAQMMIGSCAAPTAGTPISG